MKVIVTTFFIYLENILDFTSALVSITAQSEQAKEWDSFLFLIVQPASCHHFLKTTRKQSMCLGLGRLPQLINQVGNFFLIRSPFVS